MDESPDLVLCPKCHRPILRHALKEHADKCTKPKTAAKKGVNGTDKDKSNGKSVNGEIAVLPKAKKRKHDDGLSNQKDTLITADSTNGETTSPKKKPAKRYKEGEEPTPKKEKKKKQKIAVVKPKRIDTP